MTKEALPGVGGRRGRGEQRLIGCLKCLILDIPALLVFSAIQSFGTESARIRAMLFKFPASVRQCITGGLVAVLWVTCQWCLFWPTKRLSMGGAYQVMSSGWECQHLWRAAEQHVSHNFELGFLLMTIEVGHLLMRYLVDQGPVQ